MALRPSFPILFALLVACSNDGSDTDTDTDQDTVDPDTDTADTDTEPDTESPDADADGVPDTADNCPDTSNADQVDTDLDGFGDACPCDTDTWRDYATGQCAICPAADLTTNIIDFTDPITSYDPDTNTLRFALLDGAEVVSATATIHTFTFDEYGNPNEVPDTLTGTLRGRVLSFDLNDATQFDPFTQGIRGVTLDLTDACGDSVTLTDLTIGAIADEGELTFQNYRRWQCVEEDLGSALGNSVFTGTTEWRGLDHDTNTLFYTRADDIGFAWVAPTAGDFAFDTTGSTFDTVLTVLEQGCGDPIASNDNDDGQQSRAQATLTAGQSVVIVVGGSGFSSGDVVLSIQELLP